MLRIVAAKATTCRAVQDRAGVVKTTPRRIQTTGDAPIPRDLHIADIATVRKRMSAFRQPA